MSDVKTLERILTQVDELQAAERFCALDNLLWGLDYDNATDFEIIAHLRLCYPVRERLPRWNDILERAQSSLSRQIGEQQTSRTLAGMRLD